MCQWDPLPRRRRFVTRSEMRALLAFSLLARVFNLSGIRRSLRSATITIDGTATIPSRDGVHTQPATISSVNGAITILGKARKDEAGGEFPFRNEQFEQIAELRQWYEKRRWPVLSMDVKKKELLGSYFRDGEAFTDDWLMVRDHDFIVRVA